MSGKRNKKDREKLKTEGAILRQILLEFAGHIIKNYHITSIGSASIINGKQLVDNFIKEKINETR